MGRSSNGLWAIPKLNNSHVTIQSWLHLQLFLLSWEVLISIIAAENVFHVVLSNLYTDLHVRAACEFFWPEWIDIAGLNESRGILPYFLSIPYLYQSHKYFIFSYVMFLYTVAEFFFQVGF